jgi:hypothetical protein
MKNSSHFPLLRHPTFFYILPSLLLLILRSLVPRLIVTFLRLLCLLLYGALALLPQGSLN